MACTNCGEIDNTDNLLKILVVLGGAAGLFAVIKEMMKEK